METADNRRVATLYPRGYTEYLGLIPKRGDPPPLGTVKFTESHRDIWLANAFAGDSLDATLAVFRQTSAYAFAVMRARGQYPAIWFPNSGQQVDKGLLLEIACFAVPENIQLVLVT